MSRHWVMLGLVALVCLLSINTVVCEGGDLPGESVAEVHQDALDDEPDDAPKNNPTDGPNLDAMSDEQKEVLTELSEIYEVQAEVGNTLPVLKEPNPSVDARKLRRGATHPGLPQDNTSADRRQLGGSKRGKKGRGRGGSP
ncbi:unnamed protein product [Vitrella brassicaformis CCMP3155]|uniref:Secreted protein n=2 Tax=Vitrella brassicaformis TaxID=1169539 RepID=A0A0G4FWU3_VITBC|nr:unnamed protein product [Vitrella brassicaformis CCMP3155]|mmetsp:Transcript_51030/g.128026  ORF Transcript_51030/g.128026 Transcript_51030/m.128026 type:complete len:141 (+) Transcript_51030:163-585(+)|eukprot:CEM19725.1 unnamed protein product [Vitrella brassicaformis CCMP3155]